MTAHPFVVEAPPRTQRSEEATDADPRTAADDATGRATISGEQEHREETKEKNYLRRERRYGSFSRSMTLLDVDRRRPRAPAPSNQRS